MRAAAFSMFTVIVKMLPHIVKMSIQRNKAKKEEKACPMLVRVPVAQWNRAVAF